MYVYIYVLREEECDNKAILKVGTCEKRKKRKENKIKMSFVERKV